MSSDRNLLYGILAVQLDFVPRDALLEAMSAWVLQKHRSIGEILHQHGALTVERQKLLDTLVDEHLRGHDDDPAKSLVALGPSPELRRTLDQVNDADLNASLAAIAKQTVDDSTTNWVRPAGPRFRVLRPHARGGLGEVFVAEDQELHREVALKEMQERHAHNASSKARFLLEAEITAGLEHPSIVPVYGLGTYDDGRPFYAMRLIRGESLKEAIEKYHSANDTDASKRNVAFRQLLRRFIDVCNAVGYAHSRGILHRDLKPANIMLGKFGETLVVDWGLAKATGTRSAEPFPQADEQTLLPSSGSSMVETQAGSAIGTPGFMSPEQAAGRLDELGPASDIYSLGATLYCILAGKSPTHGMNHAEALRKVQSGELLSSRQLHPNAPATLDAVCRKAMSLKPRDRYASALQLGQDIEQWLADEPVSAYREPLADRLRRRARKHRTMVTAATVLLVTAVVGLATTLVLVDAQRRKTATAESKTQEALEKVTAEKERVDKARQLAESHREQFVSHLASLAAYSQQFRIGSSSSQEQFEILQRQMRLGAERLLATIPDEPEFDDTRARLHISIGFAAANVNDHAGAIEHYRKSRTFVQKAMATSPTARNMERMAESFQNEARARESMGQRQLAQDLLAKSNEYLKMSAQQTDGQFALASYYRQQATLYGLLDDYEEQLASLREALKHHRGSDSRFDPKATVVRRAIAACLSKLGRFEEAEKLLLEAVELAEADLASRKEDSKDTYRTAAANALQSYESLETHLGRLGQIDRAIEWREKNHRLRTRLAERWSEENALQVLLAISFRAYATLESRRSIPKAIEYLERGIAILDALEKAGKLRGAAMHETAHRQMKSNLSTLKLMPKVVDDLQFTFDQPADLHLVLLTKRLEAMSYRREANSALATARAFDRLTLASEFVSAARACALASQSFTGQTADSLRKRSIQLIKRAVDEGYAGAAKLARDLDLQPIWNDAEFKRLTTGTTKRKDKPE